MDKVLMAYAPYLAGIIAAIVSVMSYRESKRKTRHDEIQDMYDRSEKDNERLRAEVDRLRAENREGDKKHEVEK